MTGPEARPATREELLALARATRDETVAAAEAARAAAVAAAEAERTARVTAAEQDAAAARATAETAATARTAPPDAAVAEARTTLAEATERRDEATDRLAELGAQADAALHDTKIAASLVRDVREPVIMAVPEDAYPQVVANMRADPSPYRLAHLNGYQHHGQVLINTLWVQRTPEDVAAVPEWQAFHGLDSDEYQARFDDLVGTQGMELTQINSYVRDGEVRYAPIFVRRDVPRDWVAYHRLGFTDHQARFDELTGQGYRPVNQSVAYTHGQGWMAALYDRSPVGAWSSWSNMTAEDYQRRYDENEAAHRGLSYLDVKIDPAAVPRFTAVWDEASYTAYDARHALSLEEYHETYLRLVPNGYAVSILVSYEEGGVLRYAALFRRDG